MEGQLREAYFPLVCYLQLLVFREVGWWVFPLHCSAALKRKEWVLFDNTGDAKEPQWRHHITARHDSLWQSRKGFFHSAWTAVGCSVELFTNSSHGSLQARYVFSHLPRMLITLDASDHYFEVLQNKEKKGGRAKSPVPSHVQEVLLLFLRLCYLND